MSVTDRPAAPATTRACRLVLDLRGIPWARDRAAVERELLAQAGVLAVERVDTRRCRAVVLHDAAHSVPALFNWVLRRRTGAEDSGKSVQSAPSTHSAAPWS